MPYKDKEKRKQVSKDSMAKRRGLTPGVNEEGLTEQGLTQYPAIIRALTDPLKRRKLEKIHLSLKEHNVSKLVCYGYPGSGGVPFDMVGDYLETTRSE